MDFPSKHHHSTQPAWASPDYSFPAYAPSTSTSVSPKSSFHAPAPGRRGAVVACVEEEEEDYSQSQLEQLRRGSISTMLNTMSFQDRIQQRQRLPMPVVMKSSLPTTTYMESMSILSPPSSPRSMPSPLYRHVELPEQEEDEEESEQREQRGYDDRRFQRQIMSRLQALNHFNETEEEGQIVKVTTASESKFTPPPSPRPFMQQIQIELPARQSDRSGSGSCKKRARSLKSACSNPTPTATAVPTPSSRSIKGAARRVSAPSGPAAPPASSHKSARGAVKKVSTTTGTSSSTASGCSSRRGSAKGLAMEVLLEGTLFKSGWSWASAYENGCAVAVEGDRRV